MFPKFLMIVGGEKKFLALGDAAAAYDSGFVPVSFGDMVLLDEEGKTRPMNDADKRLISNAADEYSASK